MTAGQLPLAGVRILDMSTVVAGPGAARHLADFGADVIKVERPGGDATRSMGWRVGADSDSLFWHTTNRGKRSCALDLKSESGRATFLRLAADADVLVENMRPGRLEAMTLGPLVLHSLNPRLVILRVTGFGQTGPYASRPGFATIAEAMSGLAELSGAPDGAPLLPPVALTDELTAIVGAFAIMVALWHARDTGKGQVADVSLLESIAQMLGPLPSAWHHLNYLQPRLGGGLPYSIPRGTYRCADGVWVALSTSAETVARRVLTIIGVADDPRFRNFQSRFAHRDLLEQCMSDWVAKRTSEEVLQRFEAADAAISRVFDIRDLVENEHVKAREMFVNQGDVYMANVIAKLSETPGRVRSAGPRYSEEALDWKSTELDGQ